MPPASVTPITDEITLADGLGAEHGNDVRSARCSASEASAGLSPTPHVHRGFHP